MGPGWGKRAKNLDAAGTEAYLERSVAKNIDPALCTSQQVTDPRNARTGRGLVKFQGGCFVLKRILVPVRGDGMGEVLLRFASRLVHRHKAQIVVAHCRAQPEDLLPYAGMMPSFARKTMVEQATELANQEEKALRADLHRLGMELDLKETENPVSGYASVTFVEEFGRMADVIQHNGRLSDLIVVAQPDRDRNLGSNSGSQDRPSLGVHPLELRLTRSWTSIIAR